MFIKTYIARHCEKFSCEDFAIARNVPNTLWQSS